MRLENESSAFFVILTWLICLNGEKLTQLSTPYLCKNMHKIFYCDKHNDKFLKDKQKVFLTKFTISSTVPTYEVQAHYMSTDRSHPEAYSLAPEAPSVFVDRACPVQSLATCTASFRPKKISRPSVRCQSDKLP